MFEDEKNDDQVFIEVPGELFWQMRELWPMGPGVSEHERQVRQRHRLRSEEECLRMILGLQGSVIFAQQH